jgi:hypothetical protein
MLKILHTWNKFFGTVIEGHEISELKCQESVGYMIEIGNEELGNL